MAQTSDKTEYPAGQTFAAVHVMDESVEELKLRLDGTEGCTYAFALFDARWLHPHYDKAAFISGITLEQLMQCLDGIAYYIMMFTDGETVMTNYRSNERFPYAGDLHECSGRIEKKAAVSYFLTRYSLLLDEEYVRNFERMDFFTAVWDKFVFYDP